jgi:hypothetical protein
MISRILLTLLLLGSVAFIVAKGPAVGERPPHVPEANSLPDTRLTASMQIKLDHIQQNGQRSRPDQSPTVMSEEEVNDYMASGHIEMPKGVKKLRFEGRSGVVTAFLNVDFDELRDGQKTANPMLSVFSGRHDVRVEATASGADAQGKVSVREVTIDGFSVPRMALEYFVSKYIAPKYPNIGLDSQFQLPNRIDLATVGYHKLTVTQK